MLSVQSQRNNAGSISTGYIIPSLNDVHFITAVPCTKLLMGILGCRAERVTHGRMLILSVDRCPSCNVRYVSTEMIPE